MSHLPGSIDAGVVIGRVHLTRPEERRAPAIAPARPVSARSGDHRIVVGELRIETDAQLPDHEARRLGGRIAQALSERLEALQARRVESFLAGRSRGAAVRIGTLRLVLRGGEAAHLDIGAVASALASAVEGGSAS